MINKEKNFVSAVIYVHNAAFRIEQFLKMIIDVLENNFEHSEIICVNDYSSDDTLKIIKKASNEAATTSISVVNMSRFHGLEVAMNAGVDLAIGDFVFEFDNAIYDFDKDEIMTIYRKALEGFDVVCAAPDKKNKFSSRIFYNIFERFTNSSYRMETERFRILSRRVINRISSLNKTIPYRKVVYANSGLKTFTIKYHVIDSEKIKIDKNEKAYRTRLAIDSLILFTEVGYRFSMSMTMLMMIISVFMVFYSLFTYLIAQPVAGWTTTILFLSVAFFGLFGILTVIIKYLQIIVDLVFRRKQYVFESIEKLTK